CARRQSYGNFYFDYW
nr:immunoglobulin heavy chain junction region [Mus musculus]MBK4188174.1 immunoglobulin heavy chain junction region [Mus musculus]